MYALLDESENLWSFDDVEFLDEDGIVFDNSSIGFPADEVLSFDFYVLIWAIKLSFFQNYCSIAIGMKGYENDFVENFITFKKDKFGDSTERGLISFSTWSPDGFPFKYTKMSIPPLLEEGSQLMFDISYNKVNNSFAMMYPEITTRERCSPR